MQASLHKVKTPSYTGLSLGKVFQVYPEANMVDLLMFNGSILKRVQVMTPFASSNTGIVNLPISKYKKVMLNRRNPLAEADTAEESDVIAVLGFFGSPSRPVVLGFLFPENCEILCGKDQLGNEDGTQFLWKHESNAYVRVAKPPVATDPVTPDIEISHPSGLFIKMGRNSILEPITNWDKEIRPFKKLNPETNVADSAPFVHLYHPSGTRVTIHPIGDVEIFVEGNVQSTVTGNVTELVEGNVNRTVNGNDTTTVKGTWLRKSDTEIEDQCTTIHHNK